MKHFTQVNRCLEARNILAKLRKYPELWDKNPARLAATGPHTATHDIILRYKDETPNFENFNLWLEFSDPHIPCWYKSIDYLPEVKTVALDLMRIVRGEMLGAVFIYKVEPGKSITPHRDWGWHAEYYDKYNICLQTNPKAAFCYEDEVCRQVEGDVHRFENHIKHWVVNEGDTDHIILTVCIRTDRGYRVPWSPEGWTLDKQREAVMNTHSRVN